MSETFALVPTLKALAPVLPKQKLTGWVSVAVDTTGRKCAAKILFLDKDYKNLGKDVVGAEVDSTGGFAWQELAVTTPDTGAPDGAVWAAIVPTFTADDKNFEFYASRHKLATEGTYVPGPTTWTPPKYVKIRLKADRVNLCCNPSFRGVGDPAASGDWGWLAQGNTASKELDPGGGRDSDSNALKVTTTEEPAIATPFAGVRTAYRLWLGIEVASETPCIPDMKPNTWYTVSAYVRLAEGSGPVYLGFHDGTHDVWADAPAAIDADHPAGTWQRLTLTLQTTNAFGGNGRLSLGYRRMGTGNFGVFDIDQVMVEEGITLREYFDADFPDPDTLWESQRGASRSLLYKNRRSSQELLERVIGNYLPLGTAVRIEFSDLAYRDIVTRLAQSNIQ